MSHAAATGDLHQRLMRRRRLTVGAVLVLAAAAFGSAGAAAALNGGSPSPIGAAATFPSPDRPVAGIVSSSWGDEATRDRADEVGQIVRALHLQAGATVADIGAGDGYDTVRLSRRLGPTGHVLAEDVTASYVESLKRTVERERLENVTVILGRPGDPTLPPGSADAVILVHMFHEITDPFGLLFNLAPALKAGGRVGVEELNRPTEAHGTPPARLRCEFEAVGYRFMSIAPMQGGLGYFAVFSPPAASSRPRPEDIRPCRG